jgi:uncharacterized protein Smg (DUF494 family)
MADDSVKIAVLEQKLVDFANIVNKLDFAVEKISEVNTNIAKMLAVHDERIEQCNKSDDVIIQMIHDLKIDNEKEHNAVIERIEAIEKDVKDVGKIKWITVGIGIVLSITMASVSSLASGILTIKTIDQSSLNIPVK